MGTVRIKRSTWNRIDRVLKDYEGGYSVKPGQPYDRDIVLVYNNSGSNVTRFSVLGIDNVMITPTDSQVGFLSKRAFVGNTPSTSTHSDGKFVITIDAIPNGKCGKAVTSGLAVVQVSVSDSSHAYADVGSSSSYLVSAESGPCSILWKEAGTGTKWAVVRFGGSGGGSGTSTQWAIVTQAPEYNDPTKNKYVVQKASVNAYGEWEGDSSNINITRAIGYEGYLDGVDDDCEDIRNWSPWYMVGAVVRIVERWDEAAGDSMWYIDETMAYGGSETESSVRADGDTGRIRSVWQ